MTRVVTGRWWKGEQWKAAKNGAYTGRFANVGSKMVHCDRFERVGA